MSEGEMNLKKKEREFIEKDERLSESK